MLHSTATADMAEADDYDEDGKTFDLGGGDYEEYDDYNNSSGAAGGDGYSGAADSMASPKNRDRGLDLNLAKTEESKHGLTYGDAVEDGIQEQSILVVFELPDGSSGEEEVSPAQCDALLRPMLHT